MKIRIGHISMQAPDPDAQQTSDAKKVFARARSRNYRWQSGTEANTTSDSEIYRKAAGAEDFRYVRGGDLWVAVRRPITHGLEHEFTKLIDGQAGVHPQMGVFRVTFKDLELGWLTLLGSHYQTVRQEKANPGGNKLLTDEITRQAIKYGAARRKVFYFGDQNLDDKTTDTFKGGPLTTCWDELKSYPDTHDTRTIDVIASYDADTRVKCVSARVLTDNQVPLHSDHSLVEADYEIKVD
jgi:hypothetical protein